MTSKIEISLQKGLNLISGLVIPKAIKTNQDIRNFIWTEKIDLVHLWNLGLKDLLLRFSSNAFN